MGMVATHCNSTKTSPRRYMGACKVPWLAPGRWWLRSLAPGSTRNDDQHNIDVWSWPGERNQNHA
eukprot:6370654-Alexandrium_andersonii.AAC.1